MEGGVFVQVQGSRGSPSLKCAAYETWALGGVGAV